jgi:hypothetical protein
VPASPLCASRRSLLPLLPLVLAPAAAAQWASLPRNPAQSVYAGNWYVAHDTGAGVAVFSAIAQRFDLVSPAGSHIARLADSAVAIEDGPGTVRGWSALRNASATQSFSTNYTFVSNGESYVAALDNAPSTFGVLRAYSAFTNTWANLAFGVIPPLSLVSNANVAVQQEGLHYHAYSPYTGQWATLTVAAAGGTPFCGPDYAAVDLRGTSGPRQYAAFSARRGTWTLSPAYPAGGAGRVSASTANAFAIQVDTGSASSFVYAGYTPITGQWTQSALAHSASSSQQVLAFKNIVRIQDGDPAARYEIFGAGNGTWQSLTGANLVEDSVHEDFHVVRSSSSPVVHAASALIGGGYTSLALPTPFPGVSQGSHGCILVDGTASAYAYTAATNAFLPPVPQPPFANVSQSCSGTVGGFTMQGSAAAGTQAQAFSVRHGTWVAGPAIDPSASWTTYAGGAVLLAAKSTFPGYEFHVFDEHRNAWNAPVAVAAQPAWFTVGPNTVIHPSGPGTLTAYSAARGTWTSQGGIGAITSGGGTPTLRENLAWFIDANDVIWVFAIPDRAQSWEQWPVGAQFATSGATPGGATPSFGVSMRGSPTQFAALYGALALAPSPVSIPGIAGTLDLLPQGAVQLATPGLFDADGVVEARIPLPVAAPPGLQLWMQMVTLDVISGQIGFAGRATGTRFF